MHSPYSSQHSFTVRTLTLQSVQSHLLGLLAFANGRFLPKRAFPYDLVQKVCNHLRHVFYHYWCGHSGRSFICKPSPADQHLWNSVDKVYLGEFVDQAVLSLFDAKVVCNLLIHFHLSIMKDYYGNSERDVTFAIQRSSYSKWWPDSTPEIRWGPVDLTIILFLSFHRAALQLAAQTLQNLHDGLNLSTSIVRFVPLCLRLTRPFGEILMQAIKCT